MPERYPPDFADVLSDTADVRKAKKKGQKERGMDETHKLKDGQLQNVARHLAMQDWSRLVSISD